MSNEGAKRLENVLFGDNGQKAYALLDGASVQGLLAKLQGHDSDYTCLFAGDLHPEVAQTAPYLVHLPDAQDFFMWLSAEGWGNHWGVYANLPAEMPFREVRKHFRGFLRVRSPEGNPLLFRYYDPRVLRVFLPTCEEAELQLIFGPVTGFYYENEEGELGIARFDGGELIVEG